MAFNAIQLRFFSDLIQKEIGVTYSESTYFQLEKRLVEVTKALGLAGEDALYKAAVAGLQGAAKQLLLDVATNNETSFFRDPRVFRTIEQNILPGILAANPGAAVIRVWCAASSFGQEPYSLAMLLSELAQKGVKMPRFDILATDISEAALGRAKAARYSQLEIQRGLPAPLLVKYFTKAEDDYWTLNPEIRLSVQFRRQNLLEPLSALGKFDLVLCRNVLIYQTDAKKKEILGEIAKLTAPGGGALVLGAAESLLGLSDAYDQKIGADGAIYYLKK